MPEDGGKVVEDGEKVPEDEGIMVEDGEKVVEDGENVVKYPVPSYLQYSILHKVHSPSLFPAHCTPVPALCSLVQHLVSCPELCLLPLLPALPLPLLPTRTPVPAHNSYLCPCFLNLTQAPTPASYPHPDLVPNHDFYSCLRTCS
ncbi:hypothetical protein Pmani_007232 [Petrolisthes manimaculis]|uniref:Uncharacterized protein n=1 Tax=Petrolisthes manimaculis TaxID=1843537 RepID=A0AAE1UIW8_9EUCA|nr:hypothetical protein Pmani_007232 [Petrolisthes manimaculis]